jgi:menaquinone-dependent protoporphyrinogen oxidase
MNVLVAYASKMGGTRGIAAAVAKALDDHGIQAHLSPASSVRSVADYDAIVLGSAIYTNRWRPEAVRLLDRIHRTRPGVPLFLFQSGPLEPTDEFTEPPTPAGIRTRAEALGADVTTFGGRVQQETAVGFIAKKMASGEHAGDFRNFDRIRDWADGIAESLATVA